MASPDTGHLSKAINNQIQWTPLKIALVEYPKGDLLGLFLALCSLAPVLVSSGFLSLIFFRRDLHTITFFIGSLFNEALNYLLKNIFCDARPSLRDLHHNDYGMPSSHSQYAWFLAAYLIIFIFVRLHHLSNNASLENVWKAIFIFGCLSFAFLVSISRLYLQYHSVEQVLWGAVVGVLFASTWFAITHLILTPYFPVIVSWKLSELLLLRDTTLIPNVLWFEYTNTRQECRARARKLVSMKSQ